MPPQPPPSENASNHWPPKLERSTCESDDQQQVADVIGKVAIGQVPAMLEIIITTAADGSQETGPPVIQANGFAGNFQMQTTQSSLDAASTARLNHSAQVNSANIAAQSFISAWWQSSSDKNNIIIMMKMLHVVCRGLEKLLFRSKASSSRKERQSQSGAAAARWFAMASITIICLCLAGSISAEAVAEIGNSPVASNGQLGFVARFDGASRSQLRTGELKPAKIEEFVATG